MNRNFNVRRFHAMLSKLHIMDQKANLLAGYNAEHTTELSDSQLEDLVRRVTAMVNSRYTSDPELKKWRSYCMVKIQEYGVYSTPDDWSKVNAFLLDKRVCGHYLYELDIAQLQELHRKLTAMCIKRNAKVSVEQNLAAQN